MRLLDLFPKRIFDIHDPIRMKWHFQLRVGLSPLYAHKKNHNFSDTPCDKCDVCKRTENLEHFFLNCIRFTETRHTLLNSVLTLNVNFTQLNPQNKIQLLLYGDTSFSDAINKLLLISTLKFRRDCSYNLHLLNWLKFVRTSFCVLCWQAGIDKYIFILLSSVVLPLVLCNIFVIP